MNFDKIINRHNTNSYKWDKYPKDVLPMWVADMDFEAPDVIKNSLQKIVDHGIYGYSAMPERLLDVFINRLRDLHNWNIQKDWVVCLPGLVPGLFNTTSLFPEKSIKTLVNIPVYHHFLHSADQQIRVEIPFIWKNENWTIDFEEFEKIVSQGVKLFLLCNPHNPNGHVFTREELENIAEVCIKYDVLLCSDEIHCDLILDESKKHISVATLNKHIENQSITLLSPSKTFNIAGLGCSFAVIPNPEIRKKFIKGMFGIMPMLSSFAFEAALAAYSEGGPWRKEMLDYLRKNHTYFLNEINQIKGLEMKPLDATYLAWVSYEGLEVENFTEILETFGLGVQDALIFGSKKHFRINLATQKVNVEKAIVIIKTAVESLKS
jgi:cysteine-S-conjugate beta-lyase